MALLVVLATAGCSGKTDTATLRPNPTNTFELESRDNALPKQFPSDFPLTRDRTVLYSAVSALGAVVYFSSSISGNALRAFMLDGLKSDGWKLHSCSLARRSPESVWLMVASKTGRVATVTVGYSQEFAARLQGAHYTFFVSIAQNTAPPNTTAKACLSTPSPP